MSLSLRDDDYWFSVTFFEKFNLAFYGTKKIKKEDGRYSCNIYSDPEVDDCIGMLLISFLNTNIDDRNSFKSFFEMWGYAAFTGLSTEIRDNHKNSVSFDDEAYEDFITKAHNDLLLNTELELSQKEFRMNVDSFIKTRREKEYRNLPLTKIYFILDQNNLLIDLSKYFKNIRLQYRSKPSNEEKINWSTITSKKPFEWPKYLKTIEIEIIEDFQSDCFLSIAYLEFIKLIKSNTVVNKCENCGQYFIPKTRNNEVYCDACKPFGYTNKVKNDIYMTAYRNEYKARHARLRKAKQDGSYYRKEKSAISKWSEIALAEAKKAKLNYMPIEDFKDWLKNQEV